MSLSRTIPFAVAFGLWSVATVHAQTDFSQIKVRLGQVVYVTDPSGVEVSGPLTALSPTALSIGGRDFQPMPGLKVQRDGDPVWDGAAWGAGVGLMVGLVVVAPGECHIQWSATRCTLESAMWGALIGTFIDWVNPGRTTVFSAPRSERAHAVRLVPSVTSASKRLLVQLDF